MARSRESVLIRRDVVGELVPYGTPYELQEGQWAEITQALGTSFTLLVEGRLVHLGGADADAIGKDTPEAMTVEHDGDETTDEEIKRLIDEQLHTCYDPEIPVNIRSTSSTWGWSINASSNPMSRRRASCAS